MDITEIIDPTSTYFETAKLPDYDIIKGVFKLKDQYVTLRTYRYNDGHFFSYEDDPDWFARSAEHYYLKVALKLCDIPYSSSTLKILYKYFIQSATNFLQEKDNEKK